MSWAEIKKAVNSDISMPLNEKIDLDNILKNVPKRIFVNSVTVPRGSSANVLNITGLENAYLLYLNLRMSAINYGSSQSATDAYRHGCKVTATLNGKQIINKTLAKSKPTTSYYNKEVDYIKAYYPFVTRTYAGSTNVDSTKLVSNTSAMLIDGEYVMSGIDTISIARASSGIYGKSMLVDDIDNTSFNTMVYLTFTDGLMPLKSLSVTYENPSAYAADNQSYGREKITVNGANLVYIQL